MIWFLVSAVGPLAPSPEPEPPDSSTVRTGDSPSSALAEPDEVVLPAGSDTAPCNLTTGSSSVGRSVSSSRKTIMPLATAPVGTRFVSSSKVTWKSSGSTPSTVSSNVTPIDCRLFVSGSSPSSSPSGARPVCAETNFGRTWSMVMT